MDEKTTYDGRTAMERLACEMAECVAMFLPNAWCYNHGVSVMGNYDECVKAARADIERRIEEADLEDDRARDVALGDWKAKADAMDETCRVLGVDSYNLAADAARSLVDEHCELKELRGAGRVVPEVVSWPRYEDGEPVRIGGEVDLSGKPLVVERVELSTSGCVLRGTIDGACGHTKVASHGVPFKRPAPKAVGADGREVKAGDTVWTDDGREWTVMKADQGYCRVREASPARGFFIEERYIAAGLLTHERPDSWERLREDAVNDYTYYWGCHASPCLECPCKTGGKKPKERYGVGSCRSAMHLDLVARAERLAGVQGE